MHELIRLIREQSRPMLPEKADLPPEWEKLVPASGVPETAYGIKAVLFDVYGTLFVSGAGDINESSGLSEDPVMAAMTSYFRSAVTAAHEKAKTAFPEIKVEAIWNSYNGRIPEGWPQPGRNSREFALRYELAVNPAYPMPDAVRAITGLRERGMILGIISNAQFFSPLLFEAFFGETLSGLGFNPGLLVWSFETGEAKPSPRLFQTASEKLAELGIKNGQALFIGNDMKNDIIPASRAGFRTALFAGDRHSLRLRGLVPETNIPSMVLRDLETLAGIR